MKSTISRRTLLRRTAALTTGVVVATAGSTVRAGSDDPPCVEDPVSVSDHDPDTGEIFDRDRHHHWDTV